MYMYSCNDSLRAGSLEIIGQNRVMLKGDISTLKPRCMVATWRYREMPLQE